MKKKYLSINTNYRILPANLTTDSSSIFSKKNYSKTKPLFSFLSLLMMFFLGNNMMAQTKVVYTSSGSWTCPPGVTSITLEAWGAGGGGTIGAAPKGYTGGGGGGGAYAILNTVTVTPGKTYYFTVAGPTSYDTDGASTSGDFDGRIIKAVGGSKGGTVGYNSPGGLGGNKLSCIGDVARSGGNGGTSKGDPDNGGSGAGGGGGSGAGSTADGADGNSAGSTSFGGIGGTATNYNGGAGGNGGNNGNAGQAASTSGYGGGGGGSGDYRGAAYATRAGGGQNGAIIITLNLIYGPGGVTNNLQLWLRADLLDGTTSVLDGTAVRTWKTQALGDNATNPLTSSAPFYRNNATSNVNFNSVVDFTNTTTNLTAVFNNNPEDGSKYLKGATGFHSKEMFVVTIPNPTTTVSSATRRMDLFCGDNSGINDLDYTGIGFGQYTPRFSTEAITYAVGTSTGYAVTKSTYNNVTAIISTRNNSAANAQELYINGNDQLPASLGTILNVTNSQYWIGRSKAYTGNLDARVAEVITYSSRATETERSNIRSYLAIKYGITLGTNGTSMNYTNSAGSTIWNVNTGVPANDIFNYDIAGIGRDDITRLTQKQSRSINNANDITIGLKEIVDVNKDNKGVFDNDKNFLVWGNNGDTTPVKSVTVNLSSGISPYLLTDVSYKRISKIWKIIETGGDVSTCKISIPSNEVLAAYTAAAPATGDYVMLISNSPTFDATSEARIMTVQGSNLETTYNFDGSKYITFGYAPEKTYERCIQFDGVDDYLNSGNVLNLNSNFTVSAWVNCTEANKTILSKRNSAFTQGYDLSINSDGKAQMSWIVSGTKQTIISNAIIPLGIWHHIGVTFDGTNAKMYVDGVNKNTATIGLPTSTTDSFLIAAADGITKTSFFKGSIDEVRIWDVALTDAQFRYVINQEIVSNGGLTNGVIVPNTITLNDIKAIPWSNLKAYYPMSTYSINNVKDKSSNALTAALVNINTVDRQTAPIPYESVGTGIDKSWNNTAIWKNQTLQALPNSDSLENPPPPTSSGSSSAPPPTGLEVPTTIAWNIVKIINNDKITSEGNKQFLALYIDTNASLKATTTGGLQTEGTKIEVSHYLKLDGKIDLVGRSQLVQTEGSDLASTITGRIERDQQGQANKHNYNYWSSPVGAINSPGDNTPFTVGGVLKDGTNPDTPASINWVSGYNGSPGSLGPPAVAISLAGYWIYKFDSNVNAVDYANWTQIGENGTLQAGKGFTLKGPGTTGTQNLTFTGKPNNGTITNVVGADQLLLVGNPYPSAVDAIKFINDNLGSIEKSEDTVEPLNPVIDGSLYFWEHFSANNTHNLGGYLGGYAVRNLAAGVPSSSVGVDYISQAVTIGRAAPKQYIPVGQGFFVIGKKTTGGTVTFKNSQRAFIKEDNTASQTTYRIPVPKGLDHWNDNSDDKITKDTYKRVRLGFNNYNENFHRQAVVAFMDENANSEMNDGYDAYNIDDSPSDMYLLNGENELAIQGEGYFDEYASYPIGVRLETAGKVSFGIDGLENFDDNQNVFIYDISDDSYHNIKDTLYEIELPAGTIDDRFYLRFADKKLGTDTFNLSKSEEVIVVVNQNVTVQSSNQLIKNIAVFDLAGRKIDGYKKVNALRYTLSHLNKTTTGLIVKITLENDTVISKKIIF